MATYELTKSVDCVKVNKRSGIRTSEKKTLAFGSILVDLTEDRDNFRFLYLGEMYDGPQSEMKGYLQLLEGEETVDVGRPRGEAGAGKSARGTRPAKEAVEYKLKWESLSSETTLKRAKVPGGWLVSSNGGGLAFVPDAGHEWNGESVD